MVGWPAWLTITIHLEPPFDNPQLFANPYLLPILSAVLDDDLVILAHGVVCSLPSAPAQHRHCDGGDLFPHSGIDRLLPAAAITVGIPLLEMNEVHGTTALWLGTHRDVVEATPYGMQARIPPLKMKAPSPSCTRARGYSLGLPLGARWHAEPRHRAASTFVFDVLSALVFRSQKF